MFPGWHFEIVNMALTFREGLVCSIKYEMCCSVCVCDCPIGNLSPLDFRIAFLRGKPAAAELHRLLTILSEVGEISTKVDGAALAQVVGS